MAREFDARQNCDFIKDDCEHLRNMTHSLLGVQKHLRGNCAFCGNLPYNDKCQNVIDVSIRKKILRNKKRCFTCLMTGHIKRYELQILQLSRKKSPHFDCENTTNIDDK